MTSGTQLIWRVRGALPRHWRTRARRTADRLTSFALGSVRAVRSQDAVCLTLDDGPDEEVTPLMLAALARHGVRSTFFLLSDRVLRLPELTREIVAAGHEVALHGRDHRPVDVMGVAAARSYLAGARAVIEDVAQVPVQLYRPPYGSQSLASYLGARRAGLQVVVWSGDAADWVDRPLEQVVADADRALAPGGILLFHERLEPHPVRGAPQTSFDRPQAVDRLLDRIHERGLTPTTVGSARPWVRTTWLRP